MAGRCAEPGGLAGDAGPTGFHDLRGRILPEEELRLQLRHHMGPEFCMVEVNVSQSAQKYNYGFQIILCNLADQLSQTVKELQNVFQFQLNH
jgi:hypothetical protein